MNSTPKTGGYRWVICALLFFATTFNYLDRQVISYLKEFFCRSVDQGGFGWSNTDFANLTSFFTAFYAGMTVIAGWVIDKIGTKAGLAISLSLWSIFGIANAFVGRMVMMHVLVRSAFGIGEGGNFPASIKTVAEWFPKRERALATGIFNSGSNFGAMVAALFVPWCMIHFGDELGWKMAFIITGAVGFVWLIFWFWLYEIPARQERLSKAEFEYIHSDRDDARVEEKPAAGSTFGKLFSFAGRVPRSSFWGTTILIGILSSFVLLMTTLLVVPGGKNIYVPGETAGQVVKSIFVEPNSSVYILAFRIAWLVLVGWIFAALYAKRWHDLGKSGWLVLINLVPVLGTLFSIFILGFSESVSGPNGYGNEATPGVLGHRQTWSYFWGKFITDGIWWFYLFWLPDYLTKQFGMDKHQIMMPTFIVFGVAIVGSVYGGSIPLTLIKRGMEVYKARMLAMFLIAVAPLVVLTTQYFGNVGHFGKWAPILAIATICIGAAAHQAWSANLFTTVSDMFPKKSVGSVTGLGLMGGGLGGVLIQQLSGGLTDAFKATPQTAYAIMFVICALSYLVAWTAMKALVPRHQPITDL
jgi:nitrate/nitrite transporter NarK